MFKSSHQVKIGHNKLSSPCLLLTGVPQESIQGSALFLNDFKECLSYRNVTQFADDSAIYVSAKTTTDIEKQLNFDLVSA